MKELIILKNNFNTKVYLSQIGASIYDIQTVDKDNELESILAMPEDVSVFENATSYFGKTIGRTGGRLTKGSFSLDGITYNVPSSDPNGLHGGIDGIAYKEFSYKKNATKEYQEVVFEYTSPDMESGYPGNATIKVTYRLYINEDKLETIYDAKTDKKTLMNLANHAYFNLSGNVKRNVLKQELYINSSRYAKIDNMIPSGIFEVNTNYSFKEAHLIGDNINANEIIDSTNGYDNPYFFDNVGLEFNNILLSDSISGRSLSISTTYPCVVVYTCNYPEDIVTKSGNKLSKYDGICFECMYQPNSINSDYIKDKRDILSPNDKYHEEVVLRFNCK